MHLVKSLLVLASATPMVVAGPRGHALRRRAADDNKDSSSSSLPLTDLTPSSLASIKAQPSITLAGTAPLGTSISSSPGTTQEVVLTDVVYTTLTTCPVTSFVTSGSTSFEEITTTISTITRTTTSILCTKCVAPPSKPALSSSSPAETAVSSLPSSIIISLSQPSLTLPSISTSSTAEAYGTGSFSATLFTNTIPVVPLQTAFSSKPEISGTAASPSRSLVFPSFVSLTVAATSGTSSTLGFPGYGIVPSPISTPGLARIEVTPNATSSIIPVYTAELLGNAYGGGFIGTPSVYVTKLPFPSGPSSGVPPGYGSESPITIIENNVTAISYSVGASSTPAAGLQSTTEAEAPVFTATIASNVSVLFGSLSPSAISASPSENESSTPTYISLSPFGGRFGQESESTVASVVLTEVSGSLSSATVGTEVSIGSSASTSVPTGNSQSNPANVITALVAATSPATALSAEVSQVSNAVLSSLAAAGLSTSSFNVQVAVVGSSTTSVIGSSGEITDFGSSPSAPIGGAAIQTLAATVSPLSAETSNLQANSAAENAGSPPTPVIGLPGVVEASAVPATTVTGVVLTATPSSSGVIIETTPAGGLTSGEVVATIIPSLPAEQGAGPAVTLAVGSSAELTLAAGLAVSASTPIIVASGTTAVGAVPSPVVGANGEILTPGQPAASTPTPIIVANGSTAIAVIPSPVIGANGETLTPGQPAASTPTPIIVANGNTAIAVIPSPVVGANGLTSLAVFSTPIAPAAGLITPAVLLTPIVGANGLTSLAVVATPVVGANGLTSLAVGFETETSPVAGQSESAPTPVEGFVLVQSPAFTPPLSGAIPTQANFAASGFTNVAVPSGPAESPVSGGNGGGNYSIHVLLGPTAATQFQGSAVTLSLGFGVGLFGFMVFLVLL